MGDIPVADSPESNNKMTRMRSAYFLFFSRRSSDSNSFFCSSVKNGSIPEIESTMLNLEQIYFFNPDSHPEIPINSQTGPV